MANPIQKVNPERKRARFNKQFKPIDLRVKPRPIAIVTLKNRTVSPAVQLFIEHLCGVAKTMFMRSGSAKPLRQGERSG